jgi:hypothetical protein
LYHLIIYFWNVFIDNIVLFCTGPKPDRIFFDNGAH